MLCTALLCAVADAAGGLTADQLKATLPRTAARLLAGEAYTVVVLGDEQAGGPWAAEALRRLGEASGNAKLKLVECSQPGLVAEDAAALLEAQVLPAKPSLAILAFGSADAVQGRPMEAYLEAQQWLAAQIGNRCQADVLYCQPLLGERGRGETAAYGHWLGLLAERRHLPLVRTLDLPGGEPRTAALAQAVVEAISGPAAAPVTLTATGRWTKAGPRLHVILRNDGEQLRSGRLSLLPREGERFDLAEPQPYRVEPKQTVDLDVAWLGCESGSRLLAPPYSRLIGGGKPFVTVVDSTADGTSLRGVQVGFEPEATWIRNDGEVAGESRLRVTYAALGRDQSREVSWPETSDVGRVQLLEPAVDRDGAMNWAAAELAYVRFAGAGTGETTPDGDLREWSGARWTGLADPAQLRSGVATKASVPADLAFAARVGRNSLALAVRGSGPALGDTFRVGLDARTMALLGTVGRVHEVDGRLEAGGRIALSPTQGDKAADELIGAWKATGAGFTVELRLPYAQMGETAWPEEQDLGLGLLWRRGDAVLNWSGDNVWLSARDYGVLHRLGSAREKLPWVVRVR